MVIERNIEQFLMMDNVYVDIEVTTSGSNTILEFSGMYGLCYGDITGPGGFSQSFDASGGSGRVTLSNLADGKYYVDYTYTGLDDFTTLLSGSYSFTVGEVFPESAPTYVTGSFSSTNHDYTYNLRGDFSYNQTAQVSWTLDYKCKDAGGEFHFGDDLEVTIIDAYSNIVDTEEGYNSVVATNWKTWQNKSVDNSYVFWYTVYKVEFKVNGSVLKTDYVMTPLEPVTPPSFNMTLTTRAVGQATVEGTITNSKKVQIWVFDADPNSIKVNDLSHTIIASPDFPTSALAVPFKYTSSDGIKPNTDYWVAVFGEGLLPPFTDPSGSRDWGTI